MANNDKSVFSRRSFVRGMGLAAAAPIILPNLMGTAAAAANEKINFALVGCGGQGRGVMGNALRMKDCRVVAVCDVNQQNAAKAKKMVDETYEDEACAVYEDFRELIARDDVDAVIVGTPDHWHALVCLEAARAKKDIYCEKPITHDLIEGRAVANAVKEHGIIFQVGSMQRSQRGMKFACELIRNGYIGEIHHIDVGLPNGGHAMWVDEMPKPPEYLNYDFYVGPAEWTPYHPERLDWNWRWWMKFGGSQMMDWIGHHGDIAHMAMDWSETGPVKVEPLKWEFSDERNNLYDSPKSYEFMCTYEGGTTLRVGSRDEMPELFRNCKDSGTLWHGENDQWIFVSRGGIQASDKKLKKVKFKDDEFTFRRQGNHLRDFVECMRSREETIAPAEAGHRSASIGHLGKIACELNATLEWDPKNERFVNNEAVNSLLGRKYRGDWSLEA